MIGIKNVKIEHLRNVASSRPLRTSSDTISCPYNLSNNEAPFGAYRHYPQVYPLYQAFAKEWNVISPEIEVLPTQGAEDALQRIYSVYSIPGTKVLRADPVFGMVDLYEKINEVESLKISYDSSLKINWNYFIEVFNKYKEDISLVYVALPDNPTGAKINSEDLLSLLIHTQKAKVPLIVDCTYFRYLNREEYNDCLNIYKWDNLIIVDSLSKSHGLAGLRIGAIISNSFMLDPIRASRPMAEVSSLAVKIGVKSLKKNLFKKNVKQANKWKKMFSQQFPSFYRETFANFILLEVENAQDLYLKLYQRGILTRVNFEDSLMNLRFLRVSIGKNREMKKVLRLIKKNL